MKASINSIIYCFRTCRQKTINLSPFETHFVRKASTILSNILTELNPNTLTYEPILNYLDLETVRWAKLIPDEKLDEEARRDDEFEKQHHRISKDARKQCNGDPDKEPCTMPYPDIGLTVPQTEASLTPKMAKKPKLKI